MSRYIRENFFNFFFVYLEEFGGFENLTKFVTKNSGGALAGFFIKKLVLPLDIIYTYSDPEGGGVCNMVKKNKNYRKTCFLTFFFAIFTPFEGNILKKIEFCEIHLEINQNYYF